MIDESLLQSRPIVVAIAGSNGAGKSTFFQTHLSDCGLRFVNADELAAQLLISPYEAAEVAAEIRKTLIDAGESFVFETVLSDPVGDKVEMLRSWADLGYSVVMIFIQLGSAATSIERVSMRVAQGGHDVPDEKLLARFDRTIANLTRAIQRLPCVIVYDNSRLSDPFVHVATYKNGQLQESPGSK